MHMKSAMEIAAKELEWIIEAAGANMKLLPGPVANVKGYGAKGDGVTDDTQAFQRAIDAAYEAGGGVVYGTPGKTHIVEGLILKEGVFLDLRGVTLKLPETPSKPMFTVNSSSSFVGGGIIGGELDGRNKSQHCFDFSPLTRFDEFLIDATYIHDFDIAFLGSQNDRFPVLRHCRIHANNVGMHVNVNHPIIDHCDFRGNDIGLTGSMNDMYAVGCKFNYNRVGVQPDPNTGSGLIRNCYFVGCMFFRNTEIGIHVTRHTTISNCLFAGNNSDDIGVILQSRDNRVIGNFFGHDSYATPSFGNTCILLRRTVSESNLSRMVIAHNNFRIEAGAALKIDSNGGTVHQMVFQGNGAYVAEGLKLIDLAYGACQHSVIDGNVIEVQGNGAPAGEGIMQFANFNSLGNNITNNIFFSSSPGTGGHCLKLPHVTNSIIGFNKFRNFSDPISVSAGSANARWVANVGEGLTTEEQG